MSSKIVKFIDDQGRFALSIDEDGDLLFTFCGEHLLTAEDSNTQPAKSILYGLKDIVACAIAELESR